MKSLFIVINVSLISKLAYRGQRTEQMQEPFQ